MTTKYEDPEKIKSVMGIRILPKTKLKLEQAAAKSGQTTSKVTAAILDRAVVKCTRSCCC